MRGVPQQVPGEFPHPGQVFGVVEQEQQMPVPQELAHARPGLRRAGLQPQGAGHHGGEGRVGPDDRQRHHGHAVRKVGGKHPGEGEGERRFPGAPRAGQGQQRHVRPA